MMTPEERMKIGLQILKELGPKLGLNRNRPETVKSMHTETSQLVIDAAGGSPHPSSVAAEGQLPSLQEVLSAAGQLAPSSLILGLCQDGRPLSLELDNPAPGAILIGGDHSCGKTRLLKSALASVTLINKPEVVSYAIVARDPSEYSNLDNDYCQVLLSTMDPAVSELIEELASEAETRRTSHLPNPAILFIIDDLAALVKVLDRQAFSRLYWLVRHGPRSRIWPLVSLSTDSVDKIDPRLIAAFRSRLTGYTTGRQAAETLSGQPDPPVEQLTPGTMFCTLLGSDWFYLWVCEPDAISKASDQGGA